MATAKSMSQAIATEGYERVTSITAHIVKSISVQMSIVEIETLMGTFGRPEYELTETEKAIQREFIQNVESLR